MTRPAATRAKRILAEELDLRCKNVDGIVGLKGWGFEERWVARWDLAKRMDDRGLSCEIERVNLGWREEGKRRRGKRGRMEGGGHIKGEETGGGGYHYR